MLQGKPSVAYIKHSIQISSRSIKKKSMTFIYKLIYLFSFHFTLFSLKPEASEVFILSMKTCIPQHGRRS